ncbi:unnamed protein product [Danaus chrysippus]|uniref:(African queen) hypothetical protein n=1 Tax=Danaus chrysippus TaxID=151541 RepID=A0A8J2QI02_9NEOP|nr:unnamed protein product [Danaus chrysippus]
MEIDTGSAVSCISKRTYDKYFKHIWRAGVLHGRQGSVASVGELGTISVFGSFSSGGGLSPHDSSLTTGSPILGIFGLSLMSAGVRTPGESCCDGVYGATMELRVDLRFN